MKLKNSGILIFLTYFLYIIHHSYRLYLYYDVNPIFLSRDLFIEFCIFISYAIMLVFANRLIKLSEDDISFCIDLDTKSQELKLLFSLLKYSALLGLLPIFFYFLNSYLNINVILYNLFNIGLLLFSEKALKLNIRNLKRPAYIFLFVFPIVNVGSFLFNLANLFNYLTTKQLLFFVLPMLKFIPFIIFSFSLISSIKQYEDIFIENNFANKDSLFKEK